MTENARVPTLRTHLHAALYFGVQGVRGSVDRSMIARAGRLLDAGADVQEDHLRRRLEITHSATGLPLEWLANQPLTNPEHLRRRFAGMPRTSGTRVELRKTSGSTGSPVMLAKDLEMSAQMDATMWAVYQWHGIIPGAPHARFWGRPIARFPRMKKRLIDLMMNRLRLDAFDLTRNKAMAFYHGLRRQRPQYVYGYPSIIRFFAEQCTAANLDGHSLGVRVVIATGEMLGLEMRRFLGDYFGCPVVNEYGCTESGVLAFECESGTMHRVSASAYAEVVTAAGVPAAPNESGEVVVTDLYGRVMPLVRHRLFDRGSCDASSCSCGRSLPVLTVGSGRIDSFIRTPTRGNVYDAILAYAMPCGIQRFRAYQTAPNRLVIHLVPGAGFQDDQTTRECRARLEAALGPEMEIETRIVDDVPHDESGKLRYFVPLNGASSK